MNIKLMWLTKFPWKEAEHPGIKIKIKVVDDASFSEVEAVKLDLSET